MTDWASAGVVASTGIISVFAVLGLLQISVTLTGKIFEANLLTKLKTKLKPGTRAYKESAKVQI